MYANAASATATTTVPSDREPMPTLPTRSPSAVTAASSAHDPNEGTAEEAHAEAHDEAGYGHGV